jgi:hypothetical protein
MRSGPKPAIGLLCLRRHDTILVPGPPEQRGDTAAIILGPNVPAALQRTGLTQGDQRLQKLGDELGIGPQEEPGQLFGCQTAGMLGEHRPDGLGLLGQGLGPGALARLERG